MPKPQPTFDEISVALLLAARDAVLVRQRDEHTALAIGLFPATAAAIVADRQHQAELIAFAHQLFRDLAPHQAEVEALLARKGVAA